MSMKLLLAIPLLLLPALAQAADITGVPKIREGDHIQIGNTRIRLGGIDAPSVDQLCLNTKGERWTCGVAARDELIKHADNKTWACHTRQVTDRRGRTVARCEAKAGMWQGAFIAPWDWRVRNKKTTVLGAVKPPENAIAILLASASGSVAPSPDCTIKGNVNRSGECIYHQPTSRWYAKIKMQIAKGTRWFCSVEEAEAAGCRETKR